MAFSGYKNQRRRTGKEGGNQRREIILRGANFLPLFLLKETEAFVRYERVKKEGTGLRKQKEGINGEKYKPKTTGNTQRRTKRRLRRRRFGTNKEKQRARTSREKTCRRDRAEGSNTERKKTT
jgi:hypothetical protein